MPEATLAHRAADHQAAGLAAMAATVAPRLAALAGHGDRKSEMPLLLQLCSVWAKLGYSLLVLDAHVQESDSAPGLLQFLEEEADFSPAQFAPGAGAGVSWGIVPAAKGLRALRDMIGDNGTAGASAKDGGNSTGPGLRRARRLTGLFPNYELIVLYAHAQELALDFQNSGLSPLLPVSVQDAALLSAYQGLKQMLGMGKLRPTIVTVMDAPTLSERMAGHSISRNLQNCARDFLACEMPALTVSLDDEAEMQRLALRTLEAALQPVAAPGAWAAMAGLLAGKAPLAAAA